MKSIKFIAAVLLIFLLCLSVTGEKRKEKKSMKELTDPKSPSYVPYPYPKNREEIIADLKYFVEKYGEGDKQAYIGSPPITDTLLKKLFEPQSPYKIGEIIKVKNRFAQISDNYSWLIMVMDKDGNNPMRVVLLASGLYAESGAIGKKDLETGTNEQRMKLERLMRPKKNKDIKCILSESLNRFIDDKEIKKIEMVAYPSKLGDFITPLWKIKMTDGTIFFYSEIRDMIYSIDKKIPWKKDNNGYRPFIYKGDYLPDTIADELIVLKKIPRK